MNSYLLLALLWIVYFVTHSWFASNFVKKFLIRNIPILKKYYRLIYVAFALAGIILILFFQLSVETFFLFNSNIITTFLSIGITSFGIMVIIESFRQYDINEFLGLKQMSGNDKIQMFHRTGILNYVRHPTYSGTILIAIGYFMFSLTVLNLVTTFGIVSYILIGLRLEERKLIGFFGEDYIQYQKEVPALIPRRRRK